MEDEKKILHNYLHIVLGNGVAYGGMQLASIVLLTRLLGTADYGSYVLFISVSLITSMLTLWTSGAIVRYGREEMVVEGSVRKTFWANYGILLPCFLLTFLVVFLYKGILHGYIGGISDYEWLICAFILAHNLVSTMPVMFQAIGKMKHFAYLPLASSGFFVIALGAVAIKPFAIDVNVALRLLVAGYLLGACAGLWMLRRYITPICFSWEQMKKCVFYSWPVLLGGMCEQVIQNIDQVVIRLFMALAFVGIYNVAYVLQVYAVRVSLMSIGIMFPLMVSWIVSGKENRIREYMRLYVPQIVFGWALVVSIVVMFAAEITSAFGRDYAMAGLPFSILLASVAFRIFPVLQSPVLSSYKLVKEAVSISLLIGVLNVVLDFLLIPRMGMVGAAISTSVAFTTGAIVSTAIMRAKVGIDNFSYYPWLFPVAFGYLGLVFGDDLFLKVAVSVIIIIGSLWIAKTATLFTTESLQNMETVEMPSLLRKFLEKGYSLLS